MESHSTFSFLASVFFYLYIIIWDSSILLYEIVVHFFPDWKGKSKAVFIHKDIIIHV